MVNHWSYRLRTFGENDYGLHIKNFVLQNTGKEVHNINMNGIIPVNPPLCAGVSRVRALSPAWTGSPARETLISRTHLFLPHDLPPTKKISSNFEGPFRQLSKSSAREKKKVQQKILTYILRSIFLEIPHLELPR